MRLLICAGGTGGGVYPALAVLQAMRNKTEFLWVGGEGGMEARLLEREHVPFKSIPAAGLHGVGLKSMPANLANLARGYRKSRQILKEFKPDALFFTGGYVAVPMALAGRKTPIFLYIPDVEPALSHKFVARFARVIGITTSKTAAYFPGNSKLVITGYPTRPELANWEKQKARKSLGLAQDKPVLLILGGSKGAHSINQAVLQHLDKLLDLAQVIHLTGEVDWSVMDTHLRQLGEDKASRYHPFPYLHEQMGAALAAADLAISRAGASTLGEYPLFRLPAILVPYPHAWRYQKVNAEFLSHSGAAVVVQDERLAEELVPSVTRLLADPGILTAMQQSMGRLHHPQAAEGISGQIFAMVEGRG